MGVLVAVVGLVLVNAARAGRVTRDIALLGVGCAAALIAIDVIFVTRQVIDQIYLADAAVEALLIVWWGAAWRGVRA